MLNQMDNKKPRCSEYVSHLYCEALPRCSFCRDGNSLQLIYHPLVKINSRLRAFYHVFLSPEESVTEDLKKLQVKILNDMQLTLTQTFMVNIKRKHDRRHVNGCDIPKQRDLCSNVFSTLLVVRFNLSTVLITPCDMATRSESINVKSNG
jgi:hypothetical protein